MGIFGPPNVEKMKSSGNVKGLVNALGYKKDQAIVQAASLALVEIGPASVEPLIAALEDKDKAVCQAANETLTRLGEPAIEPLISALKHYAIREVAAEVLSKIGEPAIGTAIEHLITEFLGENADISDAANALVEIGAPSVERLAAVLMNKGAKKVCKIANAMILCKAFNMNIIPHHADLLKKVADIMNDGFNLRGIAAGVLGEIGDPQAVESLISTLKDEDEFVRWAAAGALFAIGDDRALDPLVANLTDADLLITGTGSVWMLIGDGKTVKPIIANLKDDEPEVRQQSLETLKKLGWNSAERRKTQ